MYFSRVIPRNEIWNNTKILSYFQNSYEQHKLVWSFFLGNPENKRDFLYRYELHNGFPVIYIVSKMKPENLHGMWKIESKEYTPYISNGDVLFFSVRVNPVVTRHILDDNGKSIQKRHDIVMEAKFKCRETGKQFNYAEEIQNTGIKWITKQGEKQGFSITPSLLNTITYNRAMFEKRTHSGTQHNVTIGIMEISGQLTVTDSDKFVQMLYSGLGHSKGFGCGLMMVKRLN